MSNESITFGEPESSHDDDLHIYTWFQSTGEPMARIVVDQVGDRGGGLKGEVTLYWLYEDAKAKPIAGPADLNLLSTGGSSGIMSLAREAELRIADVDWRGALQWVRVETVTNFREGTQPTRLGFKEEELVSPFLIKPLVSNSGATVIYGRGGLAKSTVALGLAISVASGAPIFGERPATTGPVCYFDYEDDEHIHNQRMMAICKPLGIDPNSIEVYHIPLVAKVTNSAAAMKRRVRELGAVFSVLDSVGMGRGGDAASAEDTIRLFRTLRAMRTPFAAIDHIDKESKKKEARLDNVDAFGSAYTMNSARLGWWLRPVVSDVEDKVRLIARNTKANHTRRAKDFGIEVEYEMEGDQVVSLHINTTDALHLTRQESITTGDRMTALLVGNEQGLHITEIAKELGIGRDTVDKAISRDRVSDSSKFERVSEHKPYRYRLSEWDQLQAWTLEGEGEESDESD